MAKQIYWCVSVRTDKTSDNIGGLEGFVSETLTTKLSDVYDILNDTKGFWDRQVFEFPSMKPVTKATLSIT